MTSVGKELDNPDTNADAIANAVVIAIPLIVLRTREQTINNL